MSITSSFPTHPKVNFTSHYKLQDTFNPYRFRQQDVVSDVSPWGGTGWQPRNNFIQSILAVTVQRGERQCKITSWQGLSAAFLARLQHLQQLAHGWDGDDALPLAHEVILLAEHVIESLASTYLDFREPVVIPKYDGYLQLEWHDNERTLEFEALPDGWMVMGAVGAGGEPAYFTGEVGHNDFERLDKGYRWWAERSRVWPLS